VGGCCAPSTGSGGGLRRGPAALACWPATACCSGSGCLRLPWGNPCCASCCSLRHGGPASTSTMAARNTRTTHPWAPFALADCGKHALPQRTHSVRLDPLPFCPARGHPGSRRSGAQRIRATLAVHRTFLPIRQHWPHCQRHERVTSGIKAEMRLFLNWGPIGAQCGANCPTLASPTGSSGSSRRSLQTWCLYPSPYGALRLRHRLGGGPISIHAGLRACLVSSVRQWALQQPQHQRPGLAEQGW